MKSAGNAGSGFSLTSKRRRRRLEAIKTDKNSPADGKLTFWTDVPFLTTTLPGDNSGDLHLEREAENAAVVAKREENLGVEPPEERKLDFWPFAGSRWPFGDP